MGKRTDKEFVIICSNAKNPHHVLKSYRKRWCIETCFRNMKKQGFHLERTHMTCQKRLMKLMAIVAVAMLLSHKAGEHITCPYKKTVSSPLYSFFTRGLRILKKTLSEWDLGPPQIHLKDKLKKSEG